MKVAVVCPYAFDAHGGVQDQVARIVEWLRTDGHEAWAVAPGSGGPAGTRHVGGFVSWRANNSRAPIGLNPAVVRRVSRAVSDADVVHIHEPLMPFVSLGAVLARTPPKVGTFHADPGRLARASYRALGPVVNRLIGRLGAVTAVSQVAASALPSRAEPRIVPNGIDLDAYANPRTRVPGRVAFLGRDDHRKGLDVLTAAWPTVVGDHAGATLRVIGSDGPSKGSVEYLGRVSEEVKRAELGAAEILVTPNRGGESFGIVVLEGLASGCVVVASDLEAFRSVAGSAAVYSPVGDARALAARVSELLADPAARSRRVEAGIARSRGFGRAAVLGGYLAAYEAALATA